MRVLILPGVMLALYAITRLLRLGGFDETTAWLLGEDGVFETIGAMSALGAALAWGYAFLCFPAPPEVRFRWRNRNLGWLVLALGSFFLFGEEINWGQRLLSMELGPWVFRFSPGGELALHLASGSPEILHTLMYAPLVVYLGVVPIVARWGAWLRRLLGFFGIPAPTLSVGFTMLSAIAVLKFPRESLTGQEAAELFELVIEVSLVAVALRTVVDAAAVNPQRVRRRLAMSCVGLLAVVAVASVYDAVRYKEPLVHNHWDHGRWLLERGEPKEAAKRLHSADALRPNDVNVLSLLGVANQQLGDDDAAREYLIRAVRIAPHWVILRMTLVSLLIDQDRRDEAIAELEDLIELEPHAIEARKALIKQYLDTGEPDRAAAALDEAIAVAPTDRDLHRMQADVRLAREKQQDEMRGATDGRPGNS